MNTIYLVGSLINIKCPFEIAILISVILKIAFFKLLLFKIAKAFDKIC
jgi:hypothetical protein